MRLRVWTVWTVVGVLAVAGTVALATAQERPRRQGRPDRATLEKELGLTADQAAQLRKLRAEGRKQAIRNRADLAIARLELQETMDAPTVDEKAVSAKVKAIADLQAAALEQRTSQHLAMRRLLSPEQQEKMKQLAPGRGRWARPGRAGRRAPGMASPGGGGPPWEEDDATPVPAPER
jgi:Spy/CpxP family protein refolding chaperone